MKPSSGRGVSNQQGAKHQRESTPSQKTNNQPENARMYAGIGPDSVAIYADQSVDIEVPLTLQYNLAEDISYKLRYVIHDAIMKARLSGRNYILSTDIEDTFECLNLDKVYGADSSPSWGSVTFEDQNLSYLEDSTVNLIELAEEESSFVQTSDIIVTKKWITVSEPTESIHRKYFEAICLAIVSNDFDARNAALRDLKENYFIGPTVEWFYNFGYLLLSKDITYDSLTLTGLDLIRCLEENPIAPLSVTESQLKLLTRLILQRVLRSTTTIDVLKLMCRTLSVLSYRLPIHELITQKLPQKIDELKYNNFLNLKHNGNFFLPIVILANELGYDCVRQVLLPHLDYFLSLIDTNCSKSSVLQEELLVTYRIVNCGEENDVSVDAKFFAIFQQSLIPLWRCPSFAIKVEQPETNWRNMKAQLLESRRKITHRVLHKSEIQTFDEAFPEVKSCQSPTVFTFKLDKPVAVGRQRFLNLHEERPLFNVKPNSVLIGKRILSLRVDKSVRMYGKISNSQCYDHTMNSVII